MIKTTRRAPKKVQCPMREMLARLGDKWIMLVIMSLARAQAQTLRFSEIRQDVDGISQRMLTATLRHLERDGMVTRRLYPEVPPRVEYTLTARGSGLHKQVEALALWAEKEWPAIQKDRAAYDARQAR